MWDEIKGIGGFLFFIGCVITWVAFLAPHINPTWISDPYQFWQWGILLVGVGIGVFVLAWIFSQIFKRRRTYHHIIRGRRTTRRIAKLIVGGLVLTIVGWGLVTYGPRILQAIRGPPEVDMIDLEKTYLADYIPKYLANNYMGKEIKLKTVTLTSSNVSSGAKYEGRSPLSFAVLDWKDKLYIYDDGLIEDALGKYVAACWDLTGVVTIREISKDVSSIWEEENIQVENCVALHVTRIDQVSFEEYIKRLT